MVTGSPLFSYLVLVFESKKTKHRGTALHFSLALRVLFPSPGVFVLIRYDIRGWFGLFLNVVVGFSVELKFPLPTFRFPPSGPYWYLD